MKLMVINGPNLDFLGIREKEIYGEKDYQSLCDFIKNKSKDLDIEVEIVQSNIEGEIINHIHRAYFEHYDGIVINPAAYTHYSIAIYDALKAVKLPVVEVHLSNIHSREDYRKKSVTAAACIAQVSGFGFLGYAMAIEGLYYKKYGEI